MVFIWAIIMLFATTMLVVLFARFGVRKCERLVKVNSKLESRKSIGLKLFQ